MITISGASVWPTGHEHYMDEAPTMYDIGVGLGRMPRFAGQVGWFYPVLSHTLTVADLLPEEHRLYGLLHDAQESILGDVPTTWKTDAARSMEEDLLERITLSIGIDWPWPDNAREAVKRADAAALAGEAHALGHVEAERWWPVDEWTALEWAAFHATWRRKEGAHQYISAHLAGGVYEGMIEDALAVSRFT
jgi:hypothetical protein